jgi:uncharacterized protein
MKTANRRKGAKAQRHKGTEEQRHRGTKAQRDKGTKGQGSRGSLITARIRPDSALAREFWARGRSESCPVHDMHGHMGQWYGIWFPRGEPEKMVKSMDEAGVKLLLLAPHAALFCPEIGNRIAIESVRRFPNHFRAYLSVNPNYPEALKQDLSEFDRHQDVFVGFKFLAGYHRVPITEKPFRPALEFASARRLPVLMHTWTGDACNDAAAVRKVVAKYPRVQFLLGHSLNPSWEEAARIANEFPNAYLELTSVLGFRGVLELFVERGCAKRLLFGTDLPWFSEYQGIGSVLSADISEDDRHDILHRNAERLLASVPAATGRRRVR